MLGYKCNVKPTDERWTLTEARQGTGRDKLGILYIAARVMREGQSGVCGCRCVRTDAMDESSAKTCRDVVRSWYGRQEESVQR